MKGKDIVIVGIQPWDIEIGSNCKNIAIEMSKYNRVLYVNAPLDRLSAFKGRKTPAVKKRISIMKGNMDSLEMVNENLFVFYPATLIEPINRIPINWLFDILNKFNSKRFSKQINLAVQKLQFRNYILFNDSSFFMGKLFRKYLEFDSYIYYIRDNLVNSPFPYWNVHGKRIEPQTIKSADVVVTNSLYYTEYAKKYNKHSYMVGQGCDTTLFDESKSRINVSEELLSIMKPIIGYVGNIAHIRLDIELLVHIAKLKEDWQLVLVGPEDSAFKNSELHELKNVHFLGSKSQEILPEFIKGFDVCINPQILNITTIGNYPRKIDEYLAIGKPVVATHTKAMEYFADFVYLAKSKSEYIEQIQKAITEDSKEMQDRRKKFALSHSWENNVQEIWKALTNSKIQ